MRRALRNLLAAAAILTAPLPALAQTWQDFTYAQAGFSVQFPGTPTATTGTWRTAAGASAPSSTWSLTHEGVTYAVTVADFRGLGVTEQAAVDDALATVRRGGEIKVDTNERIDRVFGHVLSVVNKDESRSTMAIFWVDGRLYVLNGQALAPDAAARSARTLRFEQTLTFVDAQGTAPRRPDDGLPGGRGGRGGPVAGGPGGPGRGPPPQNAFDDCKGKQAGAAVQHKIPDGTVVAATCIQTPNGLAARPNQPPGGRGGPHPPG